MDDKSVHIAIGLRLGSPLCRPHRCTHCRESIHQQATHGLSCLYSQGRHPRLNDIIYRARVSAKIPSRLESSGLLRFDGRRPNIMSIIPRSRDLLVWDATCSDIFAHSNIPVAVTDVESCGVWTKCSGFYRGIVPLPQGSNSRAKLLPIPCTEDLWLCSGVMLLQLGCLGDL